MKKLKYTVPFVAVLMIVIHMSSIAQTKVIIPDNNFRSFLNLTFPTFMDASGDSLIIDSAATFTGTFSCTNQNISDLTGIEYFIQIKTLECDSNQLTSVPDLSAIGSLYRFNCNDNQLTSLPDLSAAGTALYYLYCDNNQLTSLPDLSANISLSYLYCNNNQLTSLPDLSTNTNLWRLCCNQNQLINLPDLSTNTALKQIYCHSNQITSIPDLSNTSLTVLYCSYNQITSLPDLSANTNLLSLYIQNNQITSLPDLSANTALTQFDCRNNQITSLPDFSANKALWRIYCDKNKLDFSDARELRIADTLSNLTNYNYSPQNPFGNTDTLCLYEGDTLILFIAGQDSALSYQWFKGADTIDGASDTLLVVPDFTSADTGTYTCRSYGTALENPPMIWGTGISEFVSEPFTVKLNQQCSFLGLANNYCIQDAVVTLTAIPPGGTFSGPGISGDTFSPEIAGEGVHTVVYTYTYENGCTDTASQQVSVDGCLVVKNLGFSNNVKVYPNPGTGIVTLEINILNAESLKLIIMNTLGQEICEEQLIQYDGHYLKQFDLSQYNKGIYLLQIASNKGVVYKQIVLE